MPQLHPMHLGAVAASGLACLLEIVGVATPSWLSGTGGNMGLWKVCTDTILSNTCITLTDKPDWFNATIAFGILSILAFAASTASGVLSLVKQDMAMLLMLATAAAAAGSFCSMVSFAVFAGKVFDSFLDVGDLGYSFGLCIVAAILGGAAACLFVQTRRLLAA